MSDHPVLTDDTFGPYITETVRMIEEARKRLRHCEGILQERGYADAFRNAEFDLNRVLMELNDYRPR